MSFTPKSIIFNIGMFLLTLVGSLFLVGLIVPGKAVEVDVESRYDRRGHREADRMMQQELESLRELNEGLEKKILELEQRLGPAEGGVPLEGVSPVMPAIPRDPAPNTGKALPKAQGLEDGTAREF